MQRIVLLLILIIPFPAQAEFDTGHKLLELCSATELDPSKRTQQQKQADKMAVTACMKYLEGVSDLNEAAGMPYNRNGLFFCPTAGVGIEKLTKIYLGYLKAHPEELEVNAALLALAAFKVPFPCDYKGYLDRK